LEPPHCIGCADEESISKQCKILILYRQVKGRVKSIFFLEGKMVRLDSVMPESALH
jgi:hypothetical protein